MKKPIVLTIMDGFGFNNEKNGNAIEAAATPRLDNIFSSYPTTQIGASGMDVGLPDGQMGNSEVGHTNIGAGRVVYQELTRITKAIAEFDSRLTIHDFRMVNGEEQINLIFDVVVPNEIKINDSDIKKEINNICKNIDSRYMAVITIDHDYTSAS